VTRAVKIPARTNIIFSNTMVLSPIKSHLKAPA